MRRCLVCDAPVLTRGSAKFCSDACRVTHFRRRARLRERLAARPRCAVCRKPLAIGLRTNARFCSAACRQAAYRSRRAAKAAKPKKAHQRVIKDRLATVADQVRASLDIRSAIVRKICSRREERDHHAAEEMRNFLDRRAPWARSTCTARRVLVCAERQNAADRQLSDAMMEYWVRFAQTGDPKWREPASVACPWRHKRSLHRVWGCDHS